MDPERDLHAQGMEGNVYRTRYMGSTVCVVLVLHVYIVHVLFRLCYYIYMSLFLSLFISFKV